MSRFREVLCCQGLLFPRFRLIHGPDVRDVSVQPMLGVREGKEQSIVNYGEKSLLRPTDEVLTACWAGTVL